MRSRDFGKYTLLEHVGKGGMGSVYRACDNSTGRIVAVKVFEPTDSRPPETCVKLRDREVSMLVRAAHPNLVKYFESGRIGDDCYYTMEFVEQSLYKWMRSGRDLPLVDRVHILRQAASGLAALHHQGVVHRDVKPGNLLLDLDPSGAVHVKLTDLGIARDVREADIVQQQTHRRVLGTPKYVSPEQIHRGPFDGRSDVFSLGVLAYELLSGTAPFSADSSQAYLVVNVEQQQQPLHEVNEEIPPFLSDIVQKMLAKGREERYDSETLARDLELAQQHLVSGAPLVERANSASLFYEAGPEEEGEETETLIARGSWELAAVVAVVAAVVVGLLWPAAPRDDSQSAPPPAADPLQRAGEAAEAGRFWQALTLLQGVSEDDVPPGQRAELAGLSEQVQQALVAAQHDAAAAMLEGDRREEAEVLLQQTTELFPDNPLAGRLTQEVQEAPQPPPEDREWLRRRQGVTDLSGRGLHAEAVASARELVSDCADDPDRASAARAALGGALGAWARALLGAEPGAAAIEGFFSAVEQGTQAPPGGPDAQALGELRIRLGRAYQVARRYDDALEQYSLAAEEGGAQVARRADTAAADLRASMKRDPISGEAAQAELREHGFLSAVWEGGPAPEVAEGVLRLSTPAEGGAASLQTMRPIRSAGFTAGVEFRLPAPPQRPGAGRAGIAVADTEGRAFEFSFDGAAYRRTVRSGGMAIAAEVCDAVGDEETEWHALALRCVPDTAQLAVLLDGAEVGRYSFDVADVRLRVFVEGAAGTPVAAEFRNVSFLPSPPAP